MAKEKPFKKTKALTVKMRSDELDKIRELADQHNLTMSDYVRCVIFGMPEYIEKGKSDPARMQ